MNTSITFRTIHKISDVLDPEIGGIYYESSSGSQYIYDGKSFIKLNGRDTEYPRSFHRTLVFDNKYSILKCIRLTLLTNECLKGSKLGSMISNIRLTRRYIQITTRDRYFIELTDINKYSDNLIGSIAEFMVSRSHHTGFLQFQLYVPNNTPTNIDIYEVLMNNIDKLMRSVYDNT